MSCPHTTGCRLYPLFRMQAMLRIWQDRYCEGEYTQCERFKRATGKEAVPDNLLPNGKLLGKKPSAS